MRCGEGIELFTSSVIWTKVHYHTRLKSNFERLLSIIIFITQIHRVRFVSVNGKASRVKPSKEKFLKKVKKKILGKKIFKQKILEKSFDKNNVGKINDKTKIFITKIYSNFDKCHTIFALQAPFDKTGRKTGSNENVCGIWLKIGSVARTHWTQGLWPFERSWKKIYITNCKLKVTRIPHERYLLHRWYEILVLGLPPR